MDHPPIPLPKHTDTITVVLLRSVKYNDVNVKKRIVFLSSEESKINDESFIVISFYDEIQRLIY